MFAVSFQHSVAANLRSAGVPGGQAEAVARGVASSVGETAPPGAEATPQMRAALPRAITQGAPDGARNAALVAAGFAPLGLVATIRHRRTLRPPTEPGTLGSE